jgi:hypothetical protein
MAAFRALLTEFDLDGVWLDYHHSHASWEQAEPEMPETCFCHRCLAKFARDTGTVLPGGSMSGLPGVILTEHRNAWVQWRCDVFTDWVREFHDIIGEVRPRALLGTFHSPWTDEDFSGARLTKLAIDLRAQAAYIDVFSPMPYHARFGHAGDPEWISHQIAWLGEYLGAEGKPGERHRIWPIVQLSDWGEVVPASQVHTVLGHATRAPATGVIVFAWGSLRKQPDKVAEMVRFYRAIAP